MPQATKQHITVPVRPAYGRYFSEWRSVTEEIEDGTWPDDVPDDVFARYLRARRRILATPARSWQELAMKAEFLESERSLDISPEERSILADIRALAAH